MDELIRQAQTGDEHAFEQVLNRSYDRVFRFALNWSGDRTNAEDIAHQACLKLARSLNQFRFESAFNTWLYRLVINCALDWQRAHQRHQHASLETEPQGPEGSNQADTSIELRQVLSQIDGLGPGYRDTVLLVFAEGLSHREAAEVLQLSESTVSWRIHEIRKRLSPLREGGCS